MGKAAQWRGAATGGNKIRLPTITIQVSVTLFTTGFNRMGYKPSGFTHDYRFLLARKQATTRYSVNGFAIKGPTTWGKQHRGSSNGSTKIANAPVHKTLLRIDLLPWRDYGSLLCLYC